MEKIIRNNTHLLYILSVIAKGVTGITEIIGAALLFSKVKFNFLVHLLVEKELGENSRHFFSHRITEYFPHVSASTELFAAWYFLVHGVINLLLVVGLVKKQMWAYIAAICFHVFFIFYQLHRFTHTHSEVLLMLSIVDAFVIFLIWKEYQFVCSQKIARDNQEQS